MGRGKHAAAALGRRGKTCSAFDCSDLLDGLSCRLNRWKFPQTGRLAEQIITCATVTIDMLKFLARLSPANSRRGFLGCMLALIAAPAFADGFIYKNDVRECAGEVSWRASPKRAQYRRQSDGFIPVSFSDLATFKGFHCSRARNA